MSTFVSADFISLVLRVAVGAAMIVHGLPKAKGGWGKQAGQWIGSMGVPPAAATLVTILEFFGGIFLIVGLIVPVVAAFFVIEFLGIISMKIGKMKAGFSPAGSKPGYELDFTYLVLSLAILLLGSGAYSVDALLRIL
ncbi:MAG: DoxX family protein [Thaumarchaeota archaeon]|nr:DoxX family protein [Nitrososphaerota archaeon]